MSYTGHRTFSTYLMHSLSYVGQTVRSESILSINCATIQESLQNYFKLKKPKAKNLLILIQNVCKRTSLNGCFWQERASRENNLSTTAAANHGGFGRG